MKSELDLLQFHVSHLFIPKALATMTPTPAAAVAVTTATAAAAAVCVSPAAAVISTALIPRAPRG